MDKPVVTQAGRPLQRAIIHQWQSAGYLLIFIGLVLGLLISQGRYGSGFHVALVFCLLLATPTATALLALHLRQYRWAAALSTLGGMFCGFIVLSSLSVLPLMLMGMSTILDALSSLAIYLATMVPLAAASTAAMKSGWDLGTISRMDDLKQLSPH
jgi:hypothetical protein